MFAFGNLLDNLATTPNIFNIFKIYTEDNQWNWEDNSTLIF